MSKISVFRRQASIGAKVTLRLTRGEDVTGHITELDEFHVCVDLGQRVVTIFEDILAGWEIHHHDGARGNDASNIIRENNGITAQIDDTSHRSTEPHLVTDGVSPETAAAVLARRTRIEAAISEGIKHARLEFPDPDFEFDEKEFPAKLMHEIRRDWERARSQYDYALKVKEESRIVNIVGHVLQPLADKYPQSPSIHALLGCMLLRLDRRTEAIEHLRVAASISRKAGHWYALAFAAADSALECHALRNYLLLAQPGENHEAWLRYFSLAVNMSDAKGIIQVLERCLSEEADMPTKEMAAETLIYLYGRFEAIDAAQAATAELIRGEMPSANGFRAIIESRLSTPSSELAREDSRQVIIKASPKEKLGVPSGRVTSFGNQRFGFIDGDDGETYFFRIDDIADEGLRQELLNGTWRKQPNVEFIVVPSPGHRYERATQILHFQDTDVLIKKARQFLKSAQYAQALAVARRALLSAPHHVPALQLESEIKDQMKRALHLGVGLPKGDGPFALAKRAHLLEQDFKKAEQLFRQAIQKQDNVESAVKDLASLLLQIGRDEEAISLLKAKRERYHGISPYDNTLSTILQQTGRHTDAVHILERLAKQATLKARPTLLRRMAFSQFKAGHYDAAERTLGSLLAIVPGDRRAEYWLAGLEQARHSGRYDDAAEIIGGFGSLAEGGLDLSPLCLDAIKECSFEGVDPAKLQSGTLTAKDVERLEDLAKELGTRRPRDRAAYYLSAAAILSQQSSDEDAARIYDYLRRHFASMGDAAWVGKRPADAVRAYYVESLALVSEPGDESWRTLLRYLATYVSTHQEEVDQTLQHSRRYRDTLHKLLTSLCDSVAENLPDAVLDVSSQSSFAAKAICEAVEADHNIKRALIHHLGLEGKLEDRDFLKIWGDRCQERLKLRQQAYAVCQTLTRHQLTAASMEELTTQLQQLLKIPLPELDKRRISDILDISESALRFCRASDFEDKEQHYWLVTTRAKSFQEQVKEAPTQFAHAGLLPIAQHLRSLTEEQYAQTARTSAAQLALRLLVDHYVRGRQGEVKLQINLTNMQGCSPASNVRLILGPADSPYFEAMQPYDEIGPTLRGGTSIVTHVILKLREKALEEPAFPIKVRAQYRNRVGEDCWTEESEWTVRLYGEEEFQFLTNVYAPYAEGGPVDDPKMFIGRESILDRLEHALIAGSGSKCVVLFGQKRAGKSSLLEHLRRRLLNRFGCLPVQFSLYELGPRFNECTFFYKILERIAIAVEDLREQGMAIPEFTCPSINDLEKFPTLRFHEAMNDFSHKMSRTSENQRLNLVLLIDEFTEVFKQIRKGSMDGAFMKAWKAVVEKHYFASVLVGQDIMPVFKAAFPNEFGVTEDVRVTYLSENDAMRLIGEPIGMDHYIGESVPRILGLTAGNPFYTMMLCSRLVDYMNRTRSAVVTVADIAAVEQEMISGDRRLTRDKFDNLICAGDGLQDSGIDPDETLSVCVDIARCGDRGWCSRDSLRSFDRARLDKLLADLETRDVVERKSETYRLRVGLFNDWLLVQG